MLSVLSVPSVPGVLSVPSVPSLLNVRVTALKASNIRNTNSCSNIVNTVQYLKRGSQPSRHNCAPWSLRAYKDRADKDFTTRTKADN